MRVLILVLMALSLGLVTAAVAEEAADEKAAITQAALDYIEGWFEGNAERMDRALHPQLAKRKVVQNPQTGEENFVHLTKMQMVEATRSGGGKSTPADQRAIKVVILDIYRDIACVRVDSVKYIDYVHLVKSGGTWKIVNVLWTDNVK